MLFVIRVLSGRWFRDGGRGPWVTLRSPTAKCLASTARRHVLDGRPFFFELSKAFGIFVAIRLVFLWRFVRYFCGDSFGIFVANHLVFLW